MMTRSQGFEPVRVLEADIGTQLPHFHAVDTFTGRRYERANCLIRLHSQPLGIVPLNFHESETVTPQKLAAQIWLMLREEIVHHLREDDMPRIEELSWSGIPHCGTPKCIQERELFVAKAPFVSVIIPTHNRTEQLSACLKSLLGLYYPDFEIIIVDNAPTTNATIDFIRQNYGDSQQVRYVREERLGLSYAHNCGIEAAKGNILAFTDDDVVVDPYWLVELVRAFSAANNVACATGLVLPLELETPAQCWFEEFGGFSKGFYPRIYNLSHNRSKSALFPYSAGQFGTGANMAFSRSFLETIGGFDQALGPGTLAQNGEDLDAFFQVLIRGYSLVYTPRALLYHLHRRDYSGLHRQIYTYGVGLTAYLTKCVVQNPSLLPNLAKKIPSGLYYLLNAHSSKNNKKSSCYPKELTTAEWRGMCYGPLAYLRSRRQARSSCTPKSAR
jgi:GT2 family glycosyltransferase